MRTIISLAAAFAMAVFVTSPLSAEQLIWGVQAEQLEYRAGDTTDVMAWDIDALVGSDELKLVLRSKGEFETDGDVMESLENQLRLQMPISTFFDVVGGIRVDTPEGPDRVHGVIGVHGLAPQWFEIDADLFVSDHPSFRLEADYEALITNRLILTPSVEIDLPFTDDLPLETGAWGARLEAGARLSYDLIDRAVAPYIGVHYERLFGETHNIATSEGKEGDAVFVTVGMKLIF